MVLVWSLISACLLVASTLATFFTMFFMRRRWDVRASSIRWLFWFFFVWVFIYCLARAILFIYIVSIPEIHVVKDQKGRIYTSSQLDRVGIHGILAIGQIKKKWLTTLICIGDLALGGIALTLYPMTFELWRVASSSMDRGAKKEQEMIRVYSIAILLCLLVFAGIQVGMVSVHGRYDINTYRCQLAIDWIEVGGMLLMSCLLISLKVNGRTYETIHGTFVESQLYVRLRNIMLVFVCCSFVFQLSMVILYIYQTVPGENTLNFIGLSMLSYNASGLMLAIVTTYSSARVRRTLCSKQHHDLESVLTDRHTDVPMDEELEPPTENPVFVFTDIESSTELWNLDSTVMAASIEIHDKVLRETLHRHRGYEIATLGDTFQLAFGSIGDAIDYCMDVQLHLLLADWPEELEHALPSTSKERFEARVIFNGLRVRMGIHDASESEGELLQSTDPATGKTVYIGPSEKIAEFVGDLGNGGQILATKRVVTWLRQNREAISVDVFTEYVGSYPVPQVDESVDIYQLLPTMLAPRAEHFSVPEPESLQRKTIQRGSSSQFLFGRGTLSKLPSVSSSESSVRADTTTSSAHRQSMLPV